MDHFDPELVKMVKEAIAEDHLEEVFREAGAQGLEGRPAEMLREVAAARAATRLAWAKEEGGAPMNAIADDQVARRAQEAIREDAFDDVLRHMGLEQEHRAEYRASVIAEIGSIAQHAVAVANKEGRPVSHVCVAVGATFEAERFPTASIVRGGEPGGGPSPPLEPGERRPRPRSPVSGHELQVPPRGRRQASANEVKGQGGRGGERRRKTPVAPEGKKSAAPRRRARRERERR